MTDLANVRSDGRYQYKKYTDLSKPGAPMWEALTDTRPNEGEQNSALKDIVFDLASSQRT